MIGLTDATRERIRKLFDADDVPRVEELLLAQCGENLPLFKPDYSTLAERVRFAVLKLSDGDIAELEKHIGYAKRDWRDVLVAAGFGHSLEAHLSWWPD